MQECFGPPNSFLGLQPSESDPASARAVVLPVPYDGTTTFHPGTRRGPRAIIEASREIELYDDETDTEAYKEGIATLDELAVTVASPRDMVERVRMVGDRIVEAGKLPVLLGGEHLVSLGMIQAVAARYPDLTILHLDAHTDLREEYQDSRYSNACIMRMALEHVLKLGAKRDPEHAPLVQVGIRALTAEDRKFIADSGIPCYFARELARDASLWERIPSHIGPHTYISIDLDVFDPSIMPAVGTPEPGGLGWYEVLDMLRRVIRKTRVVGLDVMELCPIPNMAAPDFLAARLVYKLLSYIFMDNPGPP